MLKELKNQNFQGYCAICDASVVNMNDDCCLAHKGNQLWVKADGEQYIVCHRDGSPCGSTTSYDKFNEIEDAIEYAERRYSELASEGYWD